MRQSWLWEELSGCRETPQRPFPLSAEKAIGATEGDHVGEKRACSVVGKVPGMWPQWLGPTACTYFCITSRTSAGETKLSVVSNTAQAGCGGGRFFSIVTVLLGQTLQSTEGRGKNLKRCPTHHFYPQHLWTKVQSTERAAVSQPQVCGLQKRAAGRAGAGE